MKHWNKPTIEKASNEQLRKTLRKMNVESAKEAYMHNAIIKKLTDGNL